ncbi:hypothetical protein [Burkholderia stabilis]|uniref:hypothetical protein n=1 Tax=Burkholderia stabilis TaxID=95485 RepID=UPI001F4B81EC|nr:hypothetical protein [Burkholderia stabilis]
MTTETEYENENPLNEAAGAGMAPVLKDAPGKKAPSSGSSNGPASNEDRSWDIPTRSTGKSAWKLALGALITGIIATAVYSLVGLIANWFNLTSDQYGVFVALLSGLAGGLIGCRDPRPGSVEDLENMHDEEAKAMALRAKIDAGWCTVGMAGFGVPAILARIHPPAALTFLPHDITAGFVAAAVFVLAFSTTISLRMTRAEFARQVQKMTNHNNDLQEKGKTEKKPQE